MRAFKMHIQTDGILVDINVEKDFLPPKFLMDLFFQQLDNPAMGSITEAVMLELDRRNILADVLVHYETLLKERAS